MAPKCTKISQNFLPQNCIFYFYFSMFLVKKTNFKVSEGPSAIDITLIAHSEQADKYSKSEKSEIKIPPVTDRLWAAGRGVLGGVALDSGKPLVL